MKNTDMAFVLGVKMGLELAYDAVIAQGGLSAAEQRSSSDNWALVVLCELLDMANVDAIDRVRRMLGGSEVLSP